MKTPTKTLAAAMRKLANDIESPDGVAMLAILEAAERLDELMAQVEVLRDASIKAVEFVKTGVEFGFIRLPDSGCPDSAHDTLPALEAAIESTPTQSLNKIKAEAGRSGFIAGYSKCWVDSTGSRRAPSVIISHMAKQYAERVKQGDL